jgi:hypothetical protein
MLGWLVVGISCAVAVYNIGVALAPSFELNDLPFSASGFSLVVVIAVTPLLWGLNQHRLRRAASPVRIFAKRTLITSATILFRFAWAARTTDLWPQPRRSLEKTWNADAKDRRLA